MTVNVGTMQLPVTEDADAVRTYLNGTHVSGGLWTALTRASNHDHSGGLNGIQSTATSIPDGSITTAKLDPAVLLPYALVDGSKPFTGIVTMNADQLIRDTLRFGAKPAGVADATLARTGAGALRVDTHLGVGVNPATIGAGAVGVTIGQGGMVVGATGTPSLNLSSNSYWNGSVNTSRVNAGGATLLLDDSGSGMQFRFLTAPAVAPGAAQTLTTRASIAPTGTLALTPDAGQSALVATIGGTGQFQVAAGLVAAVNPRLYAAGWLELQAGGGVIAPAVDNNQAFGQAGVRFTAVYAVNGTIQTSSQEFKEGITPLSPTECYEAAKSVRWYEYAYLPPAYTPPEPPPNIAYDAADDNETKAEKKAARDEAEAQAREAYTKMLVETAPARNQRGFVFPTEASAKDEAGGTLPPVPDLFGLSDRESTTPQADLATLGCAMQEIIRRLELLEAQP